MECLAILCGTRTKIIVFVHTTAGASSGCTDACLKDVCNSESVEQSQSPPRTILPQMSDRKSTGIRLDTHRTACRGRRHTVAFYATCETGNCHKKWFAQENFSRGLFDTKKGIEKATNFLTSINCTIFHLLTSEMR